MARSLTIGGTAITGDKMWLDDWQITQSANGKREFSFGVLSPDGSYRPTYDDEVILDRDGETEFGGVILQPEEQGAEAASVTPIVTRLSAQDFNIIATRRFVSETIAAGTLKAALEVIVDYLPGVTLDAGQVDGPDLADLVYADVKAEDVLNDLCVQAGGWVWRIDDSKVLLVYEPGTVSAPFNIIETAGAVASHAYGPVTVTPQRKPGEYANRVIVKTATLRSVAEDAADITARGPWEIVFTAADTTTQDALDSLATMLLARALVVLREVKYQTLTAGLAVGQSQTINLPSRNVNNTFLITEIVARPNGPDADEVVYQVTAIEGLVYRTGWRETYKQWGGGGMTVAGGGAVVTQSRFAYFLGGNGLDFTRSDTPDWVPASGGGVIGQGAMQVQINTVARGTLLATVTVRLRALEAGVTVKARLYDVTDSVACAGESGTVTNTEWETVTFGVTLTPGSHYYELQLLPGQAGKDVAGMGYIE